MSPQPILGSSSRGNVAAFAALRAPVGPAGGNGVGKRWAELAMQTHDAYNANEAWCRRK
jgi:hypothetical protein